jgi:hypothetical protein
MVVILARTAIFAIRATTATIRANFRTGGAGAAMIGGVI